MSSTDDRLVDRTGKLTVATTDPKTRCVYLANNLSGEFKARVLVHELGHCALVSYGLIDELRRFVKMEARIQAEEWVCNFIANYGWSIFSSAQKILGGDSWKIIPEEFDRMFA